MLLYILVKKYNKIWVTERKYNKVQPSEFTQDKFGRLAKGPHGYWAYVPYPLPPDIEITLKLVRELSEADRALSELAGVARTLPNPHLLIGPFVRREAVLSSRIEGTKRPFLICSSSRQLVGKRKKSLTYERFQTMSKLLSMG